MTSKTPRRCARGAGQPETRCEPRLRIDSGGQSSAQLAVSRAGTSRRDPDRIGLRGAPARVRLSDPSLAAQRCVDESDLDSASADALKRSQRPAPRGAVFPASACKPCAVARRLRHSAVPRRNRVRNGAGSTVTRDRRHLVMERGAPVAKRNLEGEQSPGRIGFVAASNGCAECRTRRWSKASKPTLAATTRHPAMGRRAPSGAANGKGATAAATQHGYRRGTSFGGYEPRCGDTAPLRTRSGGC